ncbi:MAG TPA: histidine phosphatase family protein [Candidatus Saccharimonadales bacterium]|nr:histidine phosphatase family protein [Candidatus Saccharimonadales bacterium]
MQKLYFMRNGVTAADASQQFNTDDEPLSDNGRLQVRAAAEAAKAEGITIDLIITSPLARARETATIAAEVLGVDTAHIELSNFVRERELGELKGRPYDFFYADGREYKNIDYIQGAETVAVLQDRARDTLQAIQERFENNILVVSHGGFGRAFVRSIKHIPYTDEYRDPKPHDTPPHAQVIQLL